MLISACASTRFSQTSLACLLMKSLTQKYAKRELIILMLFQDTFQVSWQLAVPISREIEVILITYCNYRPALVTNTHRGWVVPQNVPFYLKPSLEETNAKSSYLCKRYSETYFALTITQLSWRRDYGHSWHKRTWKNSPFWALRQQRRNF